MQKPPYAILRVAKIKSRRAIRAAAEHNDRTAEQGLEHVAETAEDTGPFIGDRDVLAAWDRRMEAAGLDPQKQPKGAVLGIEWVASASPEFFRIATPEQQTEWVRETVGFIEREAGGPGNVLAVYLHDDETTPHIHAITIPLVKKARKAKGRTRKGRDPAPATEGWGLAAADLIGGPKDRLSRLQDDYAAAVAGTGLQRGVKRKETGARNLSPAQFRAKGARILDELAGEAQGVAQIREEAEQGLQWVRGMVEAVSTDAERVGVAIGSLDYAKDPQGKPARQALQAVLNRQREAETKAAVEAAMRTIDSLPKTHMPTPRRWEEWTDEDQPRQRGRGRERER